MLEQRILERIRGLIHSRTPERIDQFKLELSKTISFHASKGMLGSSNLSLTFNSLGNTEIKIRVLEARSTIQRVLNELQVSYSEELGADINHELSIHAEEARNSVKEAIEHYAPHIINPNLIDVDTGKQRAVDASNAEIDLYVDRKQLETTRLRDGQGSHQNITVHSQGIVQIGDYANASLTLNLNTDAREALKEALNASNTLLGEAENISRGEELKEIVSDALNELDKATPNNSKLYSYLNILTSAFQGIASASEVTELINKAMTLFTG